MSDSFWEKLGRGVGKGFQKAKEYGSRLSEPTEIEQKQSELGKLHEKIGELATKRFLDDGDESLMARDEDVRGVIDEIRRLRAENDRLSAEQEPSEKGTEQEQTEEKKS